MNTKLQDTLDALDALAVSGGHEILEEQRINEILQRKLRMSINYSKDVEKDRDELREIVEKLVQKSRFRLAKASMIVKADTCVTFPIFFSSPTMR